MSHRYLWSCLVLASCSAAAAPPDASLVPRTATGTFAITTELDLVGQVPTVAAPVVEDLLAATDDPDDPARYLVDRMIAELPDGTVKTVANDLAPFVAAYLEQRIADIAPKFGPGIAAIADGFGQVARHFATLDLTQIAADGGAMRTMTGVRFELTATPVDVIFADYGLTDVAVATRVTLGAGGNLAIADHTMALGYGAVLRLGLDHAVIPAVDPAATDLAVALRDLVDCTQLGALVASDTGVDAPNVFASACTAGLAAVASDVYAKIGAIDASPLAFEVTGTALGVDYDGDGTMDAIQSGSWQGTATYATAKDALSATFTGAKQLP